MGQTSTGTLRASPAQLVLSAFALVALMLSLFAFANPVRATHPDTALADGSIAIFKQMCDSIGDQNTCNGRDTSLSGYKIDYTVQPATVVGDTITPGPIVHTLTVTLGDNAGGGGDIGAGSQGRSIAVNFDIGTYLVCEVEKAYKAGEADVPLKALPRPLESTGGSNQFALYDDDRCILVTLTGGAAELKFLDLRLANKTGTKFHDLNANGVWNDGEPGLSGWVIYADLNTNGVLDAGEPSATTGTGGAYSITGLVAGTYTFREVQQTGWTCSFPATTCAHVETLAAGQTSADNNFGNYQNGAKTGTKFNDLNANGLRDTGEPGLAGWVIYVDLNTNGVLDAGEPSATTDANGAYSIIGLKPGTYTFREVQKAGWTCSFPATTCAHVETLASNQTASGNDFGNWTTATKTGTKFNDANGNGLRETGELGLSGWVIYADLNGNSVRDTGEPFATTDANGAYSITGLRPGTYTFREVQQAGWSCIFPLTTCAHTETLTSGQISANNDFGNRQSEATLGGNPTPTPTPVVRESTLAASVPNTAMDGPMNQLPVVFLALLTLGSLGYLGRRNLIGIRNRR